MYFGVMHILHAVKRGIDATAGKRLKSAAGNVTQAQTMPHIWIRHQPMLGLNLRMHTLGIQAAMR